MRGRLGYALDRSLIYGTGGGAFGDIRANFSKWTGDRRNQERDGPPPPALKLHWVVIGRPRPNTFSSTFQTAHTRRIAPFRVQADRLSFQMLLLSSMRASCGRALITSLAVRPSSARIATAQKGSLAYSGVIVPLRRSWQPCCCA